MLFLTRPQRLGLVLAFARTYILADLQYFPIHAEYQAGKLLKPIFKLLVHPKGYRTSVYRFRIKRSKSNKTSDWRNKPEKRVGHSIPHLESLNMTPVNLREERMFLHLRDAGTYKNFVMVLCNKFATNCDC